MARIEKTRLQGIGMRHDVTVADGTRIAAEGQLAPFLLELGALVATLALLTRLAGAMDISAIPLYLVAGLAFGEGGLVPLGFSEEFVAAAADLGVLLLLFTLGLEFSGDDLALSLRQGRGAAVVDLALNASPGLAAGLLLGWPVEAAVLLGGATYISSSQASAGGAPRAPAPHWWPAASSRSC